MCELFFFFLLSRAHNSFLASWGQNIPVDRILCTHKHWTRCVVRAHTNSFGNNKKNCVHSHILFLALSFFLFYSIAPFRWVCLSFSAIQQLHTHTHTQLHLFAWMCEWVRVQFICLMKWRFFILSLCFQDRLCSPSSLSTSHTQFTRSFCTLCVSNLRSSTVCFVSYFVLSNYF